MHALHGVKFASNPFDSSILSWVPKLSQCTALVHLRRTRAVHVSSESSHITQHVSKNIFMLCYIHGCPKVVVTLMSLKNWAIRSCRGTNEDYFNFKFTLSAGTEIIICHFSHILYALDYVPVSLYVLDSSQSWGLTLWVYRLVEHMHSPTLPQ